MTKKILIALFVMSFGVLSVFAARYNVQVSASVVRGTGAIQAVLQPGEFTVPAGQKAVNLRVAKNTTTQPNGTFRTSNVRSDKDIYSVSTGKYIPASQTELPPGNYKFTVGGSVGSTGTLTYDLVP